MATGCVGGGLWYSPMKCLSSMKSHTFPGILTALISNVKWQANCGDTQIREINKSTGQPKIKYVYVGYKDTNIDLLYGLVFHASYMS